MPNASEFMSAAQAQSLVFKQSSAMSRQYDLFAGDRVIGSLQWPKMCGSLAEGRIGSSAWTFKRTGLWHPAVTIRTPESGESDVARFAIGWRGGDLTLAGGRTLRWEPLTFWGGKWAFTDVARREQVLAFEVGHGFFKMSIALHVENAAVSEAELPLLTMLGGYLLVMAAQEESAAVTAVIVS